jgi:hypothetical protein
VTLRRATRGEARELQDLSCPHCGQRLVTLKFARLTVGEPITFDPETHFVNVPDHAPVEVSLGCRVFPNGNYINARTPYPPGPYGRPEFPWYKWTAAKPPATPPRIRQPAVFTCRCGTDCLVSAAPFKFGSRTAEEREDQLRRNYERHVAIDAVEEHLRSLAEFPRPVRTAHPTDIRSRILAIAGYASLADMPFGSAEDRKARHREDVLAAMRAELLIRFLGALESHLVREAARRAAIHDAQLP